MQDGQPWRSVNFALTAVFEAVGFAWDMASSIECPTDPPFFVGANICAALKTTVANVIRIIAFILEKVSAIDHDQQS